MTRKSVWLDPGKEPCEYCNGTGGNPHGEFQCPVCNGFGGAPADPGSAPLPDGTICPACGRPGTAGDPVVSSHGIHRSEALAWQERYREALALVKGARPR